MKIIGGCLVALGFASLLTSAFIGFAILSFMMMEIIPFDGPSRLLSFGLFGGYWLIILGGVLMGISWALKELRT